MKILPAIFFVCVGIWVAYTYPELGATIMQYVNLAIEFVSNLLSKA